MSRGRKPSPDSYKHQLTFRVTDEQRDIIESKAEEAEMSLADFVREVLLNHGVGQSVNSSAIDPVPLEIDSFY